MVLKTVTEAAWIFIFAAAICSALFYADGGSASIYLLLPASIIFVATVHGLMQHFRILYSKHAREEELAKALRLFMYCTSRGMPTIKAIEKIQSEASYSATVSLLRRASKRMKMGEGLGEAIERAGFSCQDFLVKALKAKPLAEALEEHERRRKERLLHIKESSGMRATMSMFVSTIMPSFIIFAYVGGNVAYSERTGILPFSLGICLMLPAIYAICASMLRRGLFE
jgi:hypothetical protein